MKIKLTLFLVTIGLILPSIAMEARKRRLEVQLGGTVKHGMLVKISCDKPSRKVLSKVNFLFFK